LPFSDLEPAFDGSIPIVRELPTGAGSVDLMYMNTYRSLKKYQVFLISKSRKNQ